MRSESLDQSRQRLLEALCKTNNQSNILLAKILADMSNAQFLYVYKNWDVRYDSSHVVSPDVINSTANDHHSRNESTISSIRGNILVDMSSDSDDQRREA